MRSSENQTLAKGKISTNIRERKAEMRRVRERQQSEGGGGRRRKGTTMGERR